jgi:pimeloyl-ACP methyl ester carboxylesterase
MIACGQGDAVLVIPGIQGRWEWMRPSIDALAAAHRVLTFSLTEAPTLSEVEGSEAVEWFDAWDSYIDAALEEGNLTSVALIGVSFGGLIAARYAARHPGHVRKLVIVSTPAPDLDLDTERATYLKYPRLALPLFGVRALGRMLEEIARAQPSWQGRARCLAGHIWRVVRYPPSATKMAAWVHAWQAARHDIDADRITAPTLVVTGEASLDRVVPVASTLRYLDLIPGAQHATLRNTGHIGVVTAPKEFARIVGEFLDRR